MPEPSTILPPIDMENASVAFLACLLGCALDEAQRVQLTFQTFTDAEPKRKPDPMGRVHHGNFGQLVGTLARMNQDGAGVFVTVNGTNGRGRQKANIIHLRAWWADLDAKDAKAPFDLEKILVALPLEPSMVVRTPGGLHLYWLTTEPMACATPERRAQHEAEVKAIAQALAAWGGDLKACTVERVLRVPGFLHQKAKPRLVELVKAGGPRYTRDQVRAAFPAVASDRKSREAAAVRPPGPVAPNRPEDWRERVTAYLRTCDPSIQGQDGSSALFNTCMKLFSRFDLGEEEVVDLVMEAYNVPGLCEPAWSLAEVKHKAAGANQRAGTSRGGAWREGRTMNGTHHPGNGSWRPPQMVQAPDAAALEPPPADPEDPGPGETDAPPARPRSKGKGSHKDLPGRPAVHGFEWDSRGLVYLKSDGKDPQGIDKPPQRVWIAPPFTLPGLVRDGNSKDWRLLIAWLDLDQVEHEEAIPFELLAGEGTELARTLGQGGMILSPEAPVRKLLLRYLCAAAPRVNGKVRLVAALGWTEGAFVLPTGEVIGKPDEPVRFAGEVSGNLAYARRGDLLGWQHQVARYAVGNPRLAFAIACAFAGPLLGLVRPDGGGGFNLLGDSSRGKTTVLECAASVWERPDPLPTWRATGNGLEGIAAARNDGFLPLDEMSQVAPAEAGNVAYLLANGSAKARANREGGARTMRQWRLVFLSSGEQGLEDKLGEDGKRARAGQEVRVPDVPCPPEGMFSEAHGMPSMGALAEHLKAQVRKHYGHAAREFLKGLLAEWDRKEALERKLREMERAWLASTVPAGADAQVGRVAGRFALVAIAGELAQRMNILPWPEGEASAAARVCFKAWLDRRGFTGASETHRGIQAVLDFLEKNGSSRFEEWGDRNSRVVNRAGTKKRTEGPIDGWDYFISTSGWKEACQGFSSSSVAKACVDAGILEPGTGGSHSRSLKIPGQGKARCYVVRAAGIARHLGADPGEDFLCS